MGLSQELNTVACISLDGYFRYSAHRFCTCPQSLRSRAIRIPSTCTSGESCASCANSDSASSSLSSGSRYITGLRWLQGSGMRSGKQLLGCKDAIPQIARDDGSLFAIEFPCAIELYQPKCTAMGFDNAIAMDRGQRGIFESTQFPSPKWRARPKQPKQSVRKTFCLKRTSRCTARDSNSPKCNGRHA